MSQLINRSSEGHLFHAVEISEVQRVSGKNPDIQLPATWPRQELKAETKCPFRIRSVCSGKELMLFLEPASKASGGAVTPECSPAADTDIKPVKRKRGKASSPEKTAEPTAANSRQAQPQLDNCNDTLTILCRMGMVSSSH